MLKLLKKRNFKDIEQDHSTGVTFCLSDHIDLVDFFCLECGSFLFRASHGSDAGIFVYCPRCREEVYIDVYTHIKNR